MSISADEYRTLARSRKYRNEPVEVDGIRFDSKAEARRYGELKLQERNGWIRDLELQPVYPIVVNGHRVATYKADFKYFDCQGFETVVEDVKSPATRRNPTYRLKTKLVLALYGVHVTEVE